MTEQEMDMAYNVAFYVSEGFSDQWFTVEQLVERAVQDAQSGDSDVHDTLLLIARGADPDKVDISRLTAWLEQVRGIEFEGFTFVRTADHALWCVVPAVEDVILDYSHVKDEELEALLAELDDAH